MALDRIKTERRSCEAGIREVLVLAVHTAGMGIVGLGRGNTLGGDARERAGEKRGRSRGVSTKATGQNSALGEARGSGTARGVVDCRSRDRTTKALGGDARERAGEKRDRSRGVSTKATGQNSALGEARSGGAARGVVDC